MSVYRERFQSTVEHKPVDRPPIDLAGTPLTGLTDESRFFELAELLGAHCGGDLQQAKSEVLRLLDTDFRYTGDIVPFDTGLARRISDTEFYDWLGIRYRWSGTYYEQVDFPLKNCDIEAVRDYRFPSAEALPAELIEKWTAEAKYLRENTPYVVCASHPVYGVLELACWLCGYEHILLMMASEPEFIHALFGKILEWQKEVIKVYYGAMGRYLHFTTSGDDFGTQKNCFVSPKMFREYIKPYLKERIKYTQRFTPAVYWHHTCGAVFDIIPDLIDCGVKILNPIQPCAEGMVPRRLKECYGDMLVFDGGLDTQELLPAGSETEIRRAARQLINDMTPQKNGGFIFAASHTIQKDVSARAVLCAFEEAGLL